MLAEAWPPLPYHEWKDTYATLHMWSQIVGKIALAQAPPINHSWGDCVASRCPRSSDLCAAFIGKCSPVHFFWGSFDLAVSRFSGRPATIERTALESRRLNGV